jgi:hypothetical protein
MKVNKNFYGDNETVYEKNGSFKILDKKLSATNYNINQLLDFSICPSLSTSTKYAPFLNTYSVRQISDETQLLENQSEVIQTIALMDNEMTGTMSLRGDIIYNTRWAYELEKYYSTSERSLVSGFKYLAIHPVLKVIYSYGDDVSSYLNKTYDNYITDTADNKKIVCVYLDLHMPDFNKVFSAIYINNIHYVLQTGSESAGDYSTENRKIISLQSYIPSRYGAYLPIFGNPSFYTRIIDTTSINFFAKYSEVEKVGNNYRVIYTGSDEFLLHCASTYGFVFSTDGTTVTENTYTSENVYIPTITNDGYYQGDYTHGDDNKKAKQIVENWNDDLDAPFNNSGDTSKLPDDNEYSQKMERGDGRQSGVFNNIYAVSESSLKKLQKLLNVVDSGDDSPEIYKNMKFMGNNPMNCITSLNWFPFPIFRGSATDIIIGSTTTNVSAFELNETAHSVDLGYCDIRKIHETHDFLNFEPYSYYFLYIPFCGWTKLDSRKIVGNNIHTYLNVDYLSGLLQGEIWVNDVLESTVDGIASVPISIQSADVTAYQNSRFNSLFNIANSTVGMATTGNVLGNAINLVQSISDFALTPISYNNAHALTAMLSTYLPTTPCILRYSVNTNEPSNYGDTVGFACEFSEKLSNLTGYTVIHNFYTNGINATDDEKKELKSICENGFYI